MSYFNYWGKSADDGNYHLLPYHCLDVAAVGWLLLAPDKPLAKWLTSSLDVPAEWLRQWFCFLLTLHDIGKFATSFQSLKPGLSGQLVPAVRNMPYSERHDSLGYLLWQKVLRRDWNSKNQSQEISFTAKQLRTVDLWLKIVTGHHGIPPKESLMSYKEFFTENDEQAALDFCRSVAQLFLTRTDLEVPADKQFKKKLSNCSWILAGVTVLADWLGSSINVDQYCQVEMPLDCYWREKARPQAEKLVAMAYPSSAKCAPFSGIQNLFPFIEQTTPLQTWSTSVIVDERPQLFIFEDVTGAGKTEAAILLCHRLMAAGSGDGFYVGLPTMATANAMYLRLGRAYRRLFTQESMPSLVLAHGARHLSDDFRESVGLPDNLRHNIAYEKGEISGEAFCHAWLADSRKKALLADIGVGTLDQALIGVLPARHQSLRLLGLSRKILLIDEVHAYDPYMKLLLQTLLQAHAANGGSAILLSATLPNDMRCDYVNSFCAGLGRETPVMAASTPYPLVTQVGPTLFNENHVATRQEVERSVMVDWLRTEAEVLELICRKVEQGQCVCWVRNTVGDARAAFDLLEDCSWMDRGHLSLFHSRFAMIDRQRVESEILRRFGEQSGAGTRQGQVLIATQVVEQSLDLDFDLLISDLAPVDLLIQRAGREHRHVRDKSGNRIRETGAKDQRDAPVLYVLAPEPADMPEETWLKAVLPGTQAVYRHVGHLWLTQQVLLQERRIEPIKNARKLIEGVFGKAAQDMIPETLLGLSWEAEGDAVGKRGIARLNRLDLSKGYSRRSAEDSGGWDEDTNIPTRLSGRTVDVALVVEKAGQLVPYAQVRNFSWDMSSLSLPKIEWQSVQEMISGKWQYQIDALREKEKALAWVEVLPLVDQLLSCYDKDKGWSLKKGEGR